MRTLRSWEVAEILGVSEKTATRYLQQGIIPGAKLGKSWHVNEEALAELIMSTETAIGSERNLLEPGPEHARLIELKSPILTNEEFAKLKHLDLHSTKVTRADSSPET